jgi:hypothetical protein
LGADVGRGRLRHFAHQLDLVVELGDAAAHRTELLQCDRSLAERLGRVRARVVVLAAARRDDEGEQDRQRCHPSTEHP